MITDFLIAFLLAEGCILLMVLLAILIISAVGLAVGGGGKK